MTLNRKQIIDVIEESLELNFNLCHTFLTGEERNSVENFVEDMTRICDTLAAYEVKK